MSLKPSDIRAMTDDEMETSLKKMARERLNVRFRHAASEMEDTSSIRKMRRDYARLLTIRSERARQEAKSETPKTETPKLEKNDA